MASEASFFFIAEFINTNATVDFGGDESRLSSRFSVSASPFDVDEEDTDFDETTVIDLSFVVVLTFAG